MKLSSALGWFTAALMISSLAACQKKVGETACCPQTSAPQAAAPQIVSAEPNSFDAIAKNLNPGGSMYVYLSTENFLKEVSDNCAKLAPMVMGSVPLDAAGKAKADAAWKSLSTFAAKSGLNEVSGFGASTIALEPGYYQTKWMLHHYKDKGNGLIWKIANVGPNALDFLSYLPASTALGSSGNLKLEPIWSALNQEAATNADLRQGLDMAATQFKAMSGMDLPALLASLGPNYSMVITLDENRKATLPLGATGQTLTIPEPAFALCIQVQDDVLIKRLDQELSKNPMVAQANEGDLTMRIVGMPFFPPYVRPTVAWKKGLLILSSNDALIREMFEVKAGKKQGLAANANLKKLMTGMPSNARKFAYVSESFQKAVREIQLLSMEQDTKTDPKIKALLKNIYATAEQGTGVAVTEETPEGWVGTLHMKTLPAEKALPAK